MKLVRASCLILCILAMGLGLGAVAHAQAAPAAAPAAAKPPVVPADVELGAAAAKAPTTTDLAKGDPGGTSTGTISDVPVADSKVGPTVSDVGNQVGQNKIAINFVWTLVTGFLVMFMQAGFAMVESGLCRVKNANQREPHVHDELLRLHCRPLFVLAYWIRHTNGRGSR
jgi:ammonium transporter, Amt family